MLLISSLISYHWQVMKLVGNQDNSLASTHSLDCILENVTSNVSINGSKWIVQEQYIGIGVNTTSQIHTSDLTA
jgi:hypothetical protein